MMYHKHLSAERFRKIAWKNQLGMVASELSRVQHLVEEGGGPEIQGCLQRARELLGVMESSPSLPKDAALVLVHVTQELSLPRLKQAPLKAGTLYQELMALYSASI